MPDLSPEVRKQLINGIVLMRQYACFLGKIGFKEFQYNAHDSYGTTVLLYGGLGLYDAKMMAERHIRRINGSDC